MLRPLSLGSILKICVFFYVRYHKNNKLQIILEIFKVYYKNISFFLIKLKPYKFMLV